MIVFLDGFNALLTAKLGVDDTTLPISPNDASALCAALKDNYSYLTLSNGVDQECVRVTCNEGVINIERGESPITVPVRYCASFVVNKKVIDDYLMQGGATPAVCGIESEDIDITPKEGEECVKVLSLPECQELSWRSGNAEYTQGKDGKITSEPATSCLLQCGTYENATIKVNDDGLICSISSGSRIVHSSSGCCGCNEGCSGCQEGKNGGNTMNCPPSTIQPGVYGPFTVNECGIITDYDPAAGGFDVTIPSATTTVSGSVVLADADAPANSGVITYGFLTEWVAENISLNLCDLPTRVVDEDSQIAGCKNGESALFSIPDLQNLLSSDIDLCGINPFTGQLVTTSGSLTSDFADAQLIVCIDGETRSIEFSRLFEAIEANLS